MNGAAGHRLKIPQKWRPSVGLVVFLVLTTALALPFAGLFFIRVYENQIIRRTEAELIGQSAVLAAVMRREMAAAPLPETLLGAEVPPPDPVDPYYQPLPPQLDLTHEEVMGQRPPAQQPQQPPQPAFLALGARLTPDLIETQRITLAGFRLLDPLGNVIGGRDEIGLSLADVPEVAAALRGQFRSVLRQRISKHPPPPIYSLSRGAGIRIFAAMPVIWRGHVAGVVYASRTPTDIFKSFYEERKKVVLAGLSIVALTLAIGFVFHRAIVGPMRELMRRTAAIAAGDRLALQPLKHHGTAEFAQLSQSFLDMAAHLRNRSDFIATFAAHVSHELKSPLTSIQGAAELLRDDLEAAAMTPQEKRRFLDHIILDAARLTAMVQRLRALARAENTPTAGSTLPAAPLAALASDFPALTIETQGDLSVELKISGENLRITFAHLADNASRHGASRLTIAVARGKQNAVMTVGDDGAGVSPANRAKIFDAFFTTRRDSGGSGMGLPIVRAMMEAHGGAIELAKDDCNRQGAVFTLRLPLA